jgi:hypothetical protein
MGVRQRERDLAERQRERDVDDPSNVLLACASVNETLPSDSANAM